MERMSEEDEAAMVAAEFAEREIARIRSLNELKASKPSREDCLYCGDEIPLARQKAVPGVQYCVDHQDMFDTSYKPPKPPTPFMRNS